MKIDYRILKEELQKEIEKEFLEVIKNTVLSQDKPMVLFGENFAFHYTGVKRTKNTIQFKFIIYRKSDLLKRKKQYKLGIIYIIVYLSKKRKRKQKK